MTPEQMVNARPAMSKPGAAVVTSDTAMRHSAVWACLRLRGNLVSTMPVDVYRRVNGEQIEVPKPPVLVNPGGERVDLQEWLYSSQVDLDRGGNVFGLITERDGGGLPRRIDLQPLGECAFVRQGGKEWYRIAGKLYDPKDVWHERQYTVAGLPVGLSPVAYAAWSISEYLSIQDFALDWFGNGGVPLAHLKNTAKTLTSEQSSVIKERYTASVRAGEILVTGSDWEYDMIQAESAGSAWLEAKQFGISDIARFFDCPGDLIDAAVQSGNITYASISQRNLQFLIMHLGPTILRRENALGKLLSNPRYVKLNTNALLRMDPKSAAEMIKVKIDSRTMTPDEARELDNLPALTQDQIDQFLTFWPPKGTSDSASPSPVSSATAP
ncbi:phage portal protein [Amycolatopsis speibonae]|uniref:Phage portal protein n=1 Tax=Amycolatopsis speibonae TaxID=1450224 RepID=A0ABV7P4R5_9PSEU